MCGQLLDNRMHGRGTLCWPDGRVYSGDFVQNTMEGRGSLRWPGVLTEHVYTGSFKAGRFEGLGTLRYASGSVYHGHFSSGLYDGEGLFLSSSRSDAGTGGERGEDGRGRGRCAIAGTGAAAV